MSCCDKGRGAPDRRGALRLFAALAAFFGLGGALARAAEKLAQADVLYQLKPQGKQRCDNCRVWDPPNKCLSVTGEISPSGWCNIWRPQYRSQYARPDADGKLTQGDVVYQGHPKGLQRCDNCRVFLPPDACSSVQGKVSPVGWCNIWRKSA